MKKLFLSLGFAMFGLQASSKQCSSAEMATVWANFNNEEKSGHYLGDSADFMYECHKVSRCDFKQCCSAIGGRVSTDPFTNQQVCN